MQPPTSIDAAHQIRRKKKLRDGMSELDGSVGRHPAGSKIVGPPFDISDFGRVDPIGDLAAALKEVAHNDSPKDPDTVARALLASMARRGWSLLRASDI